MIDFKRTLASPAAATPCLLATIVCSAIELKPHVLQGGRCTTATAACSSANTTFLTILSNRVGPRGGRTPQLSGTSARPAATPVLRVRSLVTLSAVKGVTDRFSLSSQSPEPSRRPQPLHRWGANSRTVSAQPGRRQAGRVLRSPAPPSAQSTSPGSAAGSAPGAKKGVTEGMNLAMADRLDTGGMGGQPAVALITTSGCPYCRKVCPRPVCEALFKVF